MTVDIEVTPEPEAPVADAPAVVVVDTGDSDAGSDDVETGVLLGTLLARVDALTARVEELASTAVVAESVAADAANAVDDVVEEVAEVVAEALAEDDEPEPVEADTVPDKVHWAHRGRGELFGKGDN